MSQNLLSAAVVTGALRVNGYKLTVGKETTRAALILILSRGYKTIFNAQQLSMKFTMLIKVKMPTSVGILTFITRIIHLRVLSR